MIKILHAPRWFFVLFVLSLSMAALSCGRDNATVYPSSGTTNTPPPIIRVPVYAADCNNLASGTTLTTVIAQATWSEEGRIVSESFTPKHITIQPGTVVKWTNNDLPGVTAPEGTWNGYNIFSEGWVITDPVTQATSTASQWIGPGKSTCLQFGSQGKFRYHCDAKTGAVGTVTVE